MLTEKIVHFVCFETSLDSKQFISKWEGFVRPVNSDANVILQQSKKNNSFRYIAQHRCDTDEFKFIFKRAAKLTRAKEEEIKTSLAGGYAILSEEKAGKAAANESKIFVFLMRPDADLEVFKQIPVSNKLNIYEAYYENSAYAYILEFFVKDVHVAAMAEELQKLNAHYELYKKCVFNPVGQAAVH